MGLGSEAQMAPHKNTAWGTGLALILGVGLAAGLWLQNGCTSNASPMAPRANPTAVPTTGTTPGTTPTVAPTPVVITSVPSGGSYAFSPSAVSVPSGTTVTFNVASIHTVDIDDGLSDGLCGGHDFTSFPASFQFNGNSGAVFHIHCDNHSSCAAGNCSGCTGMVMTVTIQ